MKCLESASGDDAPMQDERVGRLIRAIRLGEGLRQVDLGQRVGCSQRWISEIELGRLDSATVGVLRRIGDVLAIRVTIDAWWRQGDGAILLDAAHAAIVERTLLALVDGGWEVMPEWSFNHYGERGSVDIVAWHEPTRTLLLIEVKSRIDDVQELLHTFGRKVRIAPDLLSRERGWTAARVCTMLVVGESSASRAVVASHSTTFGALWPAGTAACKRFIAKPGRAAADFRGGIWFMAPERGPAPMPTAEARRRPRRR
jgi:transcriptional regulator with XRE-family HTH domain